MSGTFLNQKNVVPVLSPEALDLALVEEALGMVQNYLSGFKGDGFWLFYDWLLNLKKGMGQIIGYFNSIWVRLKTNNEVSPVDHQKWSVLKHLDHLNI